MHRRCKPAWCIHCMVLQNVLLVIAVLTGLLKTSVEKIVATAIFIPLYLAVVVARSRRRAFCTCHMRLPTVMPLYSFEGDGNTTVFSCRSCTTRFDSRISTCLCTYLRWYWCIVTGPCLCSSESSVRTFGAATPRLL